MTTLMQKINTAPQYPGCYIYKNNLGHIIYIGKSNNIRNRVRQYFQPSTIIDNPKLQQLVKTIVDVEFHITNTDLDALLLEYQLIKKHKPWFNTQFKRDLEHPLIEITMMDSFPILSIVTTKSNNKNIYLDCFSSVGQAQETLELLQRVWKTPTCQRKSFINKSRPCLLQDINICLAPCMQNTDYKLVLKELIRFFNNQKTTVLSRMKKEMIQYSKNLEFEKANVIKKDIDTLLYLQYKNQRMYHLPINQDVIVFIRSYHSEDFSIFYIRNKKVIHCLSCITTLTTEMITSFISDIESNTMPINEIDIVPALMEIIADKLFILLPKHNTNTMIEKKIMSGYTDFKR
jgi:excinuclease ABC subunit C